MLVVLSDRPTRGFLQIFLTRWKVFVEGGCESTVSGGRVEKSREMKMKTGRMRMWAGHGAWRGVSIGGWSS